MTEDIVWNITLKNTIACYQKVEVNNNNQYNLDLWSYQPKIVTLLIMQQSLLSKAAISNVRPFCCSGLKANILRPF